MHDRGLFGGADHAVIKCLGNDEVGAGALDIDILVDIAGYVARTHAERRFACAVRASHHAGAARREYQRYVGVVHQRACCFDGRRFDPLNEVFGAAVFDGRIAQHLCGFHRALLRGRVEREYDRVTCFRCNQRLEHRCGGRVGDRRHACDNADGLRDLDVSFQFAFVHDAHGFLILDAVPDVFGREYIFDDFVFEDTAACFFHGHLGKTHMVIQPGQRHGVDHAVDLLLIHRHIGFQGVVRIFHQTVNDGI